jgi:pyrroline-5-carboxylate reductase
MATPTIAFIGGGNMARSLIGGLINGGVDPRFIRVADPAKEQLSALAANFPVFTTTDNLEAVDAAEVVVLAVKPQIMKEVIAALATRLEQQAPLLISIAAGVREADLNRWLGYQAAIVRCMPNTPALVQCGATALFANPQVEEEQKNQAESIMRSVGLTLWVKDETQLDAVTAVSGSGPAYFFLVMEIIEAAGVALGLSSTQARLLTIETAFGAAKMALESAQEPALLRANVTSKGGTTEAALKVLEDGAVREVFAKALQAAHARSAELGEILGGS